MLSRNTGFLALCTSLLLFGMSYLNAGLLTPRRRLDTALRTQGGVAAGASPAKLTATPFHVLLLSSVGRSGSTFLGELLSQRPRTVFMFEPELFLQHKSPTGVTAAASRELIQRMLECNFSQEWSAWAKTRKNVWKPENHEVCEGHRGSDYHQCLREICQSSVFKVIKTIKLRVWWAGEVLLGGGVKVVHLVRDPRGSFTSLARLSMVQADYKMWCPRILQDLEMVSTMRSLFPESFTSVKYEDLCRDPWGTATKLWKFISNENNTSLPVSWRTFLHRHTNTNSIKPYGTDRDTRQQIGAWREKISERMLSEIEHHCGGVIDMLGHTRFHSLTNARNSSIPLDEKSGT
ncbi:carbohydrate sulfotransferase 4-like isoform X5 [Penaeus chinensis]|nr:carbohydrate sulfotransferase 4-like isoform X5 [Penaeus chinensis]